jgi:hypothetical protein
MGPRFCLYLGSQILYLPAEMCTKNLHLSFVLGAVNFSIKLRKFDLEVIGFESLKLIVNEEII